MTFIDAVKSAYSNYFRFSGRATRSEFWWFWLFCLLTEWALTLIFGTVFVETSPGTFAVQANAGVIGGLWTLFNVIPGLSVGCRRLHDTDRSGWWQLLFLVPLIGGIILIIMWASRGTPYTNRFGSDPLGRDLRT